MDFKAYIRDIENFPTKGVTFKDITPLLKDKAALKAASEAIVELVGSLKVDKVVGMESRGFFFAPLLASRLDAGFIPVRKAGKLPYDTKSYSYTLEYGTDTLEIHSDSIAKGERVLLHDDVLATGGTAKATCELIESLGGIVVQCNFLLELKFLQGASKLNGYPIRSLIEY